MPESFDVLILGQGLAGSLLAWTLIQRGLRVLVVDEVDTTSTSRVAAGLINPVIGKRLVLHPEVPKALVQATNLYLQLQQDWQIPLYHPRPMLRLLEDTNTYEAWQRRMTEPAYGDYLGMTLEDARDWGLAQGEGFAQYHAGYLDTVALLDRMREYLHVAGAFVQTRVEAEQLSFHPHGVEFGHYHARNLILCEGWQGQNNPWFGQLPWQASQGEILTLRLKGAKLKGIINGRYWLLPLADGRYRLGASYSQQLNLQPQSGQAESMLGYARQLLGEGVEIEILDHQVGIRPNTRDKLPFIGPHPNHPSLWIFNGFGSRGSLLVPAYVGATADALTHGAPLPSEVDVARCF